MLVLGKFLIEGKFYNFKQFISFYKGLLEGFESDWISSKKVKEKLTLN